MRACFLLVLPWLTWLAPAAWGATARGATAWPPAEPQFPPACTVLHAGDMARVSLQDALHHCQTGHAVELAAGPGENNNGFEIDPVTLPPGVSLIVDGGVTVYGTTDAGKYQMTPPPGENPAGWKCGTVQNYFPVRGVCKPLISFVSGSGIYGYGIIDGQGDKPVTVDGKTIPSWWYLISKPGKAECVRNSSSPAVAKNCQEASPITISGGDSGTNGETGNKDVLSTDLTLYKITVRNPAFHTIRVIGSHVTVWGVKVQAPWNVPNTDGFDIGGKFILIKNSIVANGDQDVALNSPDGLTTDVLIDGLRAYGKGGIALLSDGPGYDRITIHDFAMTGDLPRVVFGTGENGIYGASVNGMSDDQMHNQFAVHFYQALTSASGDTHATQIEADSVPEKPARRIENILFDKVCVADIAWPMNITTAAASDTNIYPPEIGPVTYRDMHILPPGPQFIVLDPQANPLWGARKYDLLLQGNPGQANPVQANEITFQNLVFGSGASALALFDRVLVENNRLATSVNVFPQLLNRLETEPGQPHSWHFANNSYAEKSATMSPDLAYACPPGLFAFVTGELYADRAGAQNGGVTLHAMVQPVMSQTTKFMPDSYGSKPGLLAVGSPPLRGEVRFFDNGALIGQAGLGENGTLATLADHHLGSGPHKFTAIYADPEGDEFYTPLAFGDLTITGPQ